MNKTSLILPALVLTIGGGTLLSASRVSAQETDTPHHSIVQRLAQKFGLQENDIEAVFQEERAERQTEMKTKIEEKLTQDVASGTITETQKQAILTKMTEMHTKMVARHEEFQSMTQEERRAKFDSIRENRDEIKDEFKEDMETWATQNGLTTDYLQSLHIGLGPRFMTKHRF